jgi:hypothetical protein
MSEQARVLVVELEKASKYSEELPIAILDDAVRRANTLCRDLAELTSEFVESRSTPRSS